MSDPISTPTPAEPPTTEIDITDSTIYVWQMLDPERGWNIIGLLTPQGQTLPMVTTSFDVAWQAFEIAQEHANRHQTRCRLAAFKFDNLMAVVEPEPERASDG
jgi:hypothetical protein